MSAAIEFREVSKQFGHVRAVDALSLQVPEGALFGLIGPNGAGKTTTFSLMSGFLAPTEGEVWVRGRRLSRGAPPVGQVLALPQDAGLLPRMRPRAAVARLGVLGGLSRAEARRQAEDALERVGLSDLLDRQVGQLSHGQRRRVGLASLLVGAGEVLLLDEPTAGLDPRTAAELRALIETLSKTRTIVLSSHDLSEVEALCGHAAILDHGRLVAAGTMDEIRQTGQRLRLSLAGPLGHLEADLRALVGVREVRVHAGESLQLDLSLAPEAELDAVTEAALRCLLDQGRIPWGLSRGQRLEERFLDATRGGIPGR